MAVKGSADAIAGRETHTVHDPFLKRDVEISSKLTDRLRGKYASGPMMPNGEPEFGWRQFETPPIQHEAADALEVNATQLDSLLKERDALEETANRHLQTLNDNGIRSHTEAVVLVVDLRRQLRLAEQERDALQARVEKLETEVSDCRCLVATYANDAREEESERIRAQQERDEAVAALKPMADVAVDIPDHWDDDHQCVTACGHFRRAEQAIRRLAGPEKEGK